MAARVASHSATVAASQASKPARCALRRSATACLPPAMRSSRLFSLPWSSGLRMRRIGAVSLTLPSRPPWVVLRKNAPWRRSPWRDGVELVVVADRAVRGQAQPHLGRWSRRGRARSAEVLLVDRAALVGGDVAAVEAGGDLLLALGCGSRSPASCSMVNWSKGWLLLKALITQSR